jgi:hypothetical protein
MAEPDARDAALDALPHAEAPARPEPGAAAGIDDGRLRPRDPRALALERVAWRIAWAWVSAPAFAAAALVGFALRPAPWISLLLWAGASALALGFAWLAHVWPRAVHRHAAYRVTRDGIEIHGGVVWRSIVSVPRSRVQHTDVAQGPLQRRYGLATLLIYTAGTEHAEVDLGGLDRATALRIRDHLLQGRSDDAV